MRFVLLTMFFALGGCASNSDVIVGSATMPAPDSAAAAETPQAASPVAATPTPSQTTGATAAR